MNRLMTAVACGLFASLTTLSPAQAQTQWTNTAGAPPGSGNWSAPGNWSSGVPDTTTANHGSANFTEGSVSGYTVSLDSGVTSLTQTTVSSITVTDANVAFQQNLAGANYFQILQGFSGAPSGNTQYTVEDGQLLGLAGGTAGTPTNHISNVTINLAGSLGGAQLWTESAAAAASTGKVFIDASSSILVTGSGNTNQIITTSSGNAPQDPSGFGAALENDGLIGFGSGVTNASLTMGLNNPFTNLGTINASGSGNVITIAPASGFTNYAAASNVLEGGSYFVGAGATLTMKQGTPVIITTIGDGALATSVTVDGSNYNFPNIANNLTTVSALATFNVGQAGSGHVTSFTTPGILVVAGTVNINNANSTLRLSASANKGVQTDGTAGSGTINLAAGAGIQGNAIINRGGRLTGAGIVSGVLQVTQGGTVGVGSSVGALTVGTLTGGTIQLVGGDGVNNLSGSTFLWTLGSLKSSKTNGVADLLGNLGAPGTDWDQLKATGTISLDGDGTIKSGNILALNPLGFTPTNNSFWQQTQEFDFIIAAPANSLGISRFYIDNSAWSTLGTFSTVPSADPVNHGENLVWTPAPEPSSLLLLGAASAAAFGTRRRRK